MIIVDSSVWVDYFNGTVSIETNQLDALLGVKPLAIGDVILAEILQGFRSDADYKAAKKLLSALPVFGMLGEKMAIKTADHYRALKKRGVTIRKTMDVIIATYCIEHQHSLLFQDRDFLPFIEHLGLQSAIQQT